MIEWIPIADWEIKSGEEFLVIVESEREPKRTVSPAVYSGGRFEVERFYGHFRDRPHCNHVGEVRYEITYAAKVDYPKSLHDKFMDYDKATRGVAIETTKLIAGLVRIAEEHYKGKK